jgi:hypothetical protein
MLDQVVAENAVLGSYPTQDHDVTPPPSEPISLPSSGASIEVEQVEHVERDRRYVGHFRRSIVPLLSVWGCGFLILVASAAHGNAKELFLDPSYANGGEWWIGLVSQLGILGWTTAAASAAWAAWIARHTGRTGAAQFLYRGAVASVVLLIDDLLGVHSMFWALGPLGKPFGLTLVLSPVAAWFWVYRSEIRRTRWVLLAGAFLANALSIVVDTLSHGSDTDLSAMLEDGPKFLGILAWATYFVASTYDIARSALRVATRDSAVVSAGIDL